ncbi:MAG: hypothetical protein JWR21_3291 [Herminiimonas sp.]|nr:hypothetical protein [Herminiimonas sp.]
MLLLANSFKSWHHGLPANVILTPFRYGLLLGAVNLEDLPDQLRVEVTCTVISIRIHGHISEDTVRQRHSLMLQSFDATGLKNILFDARSAQPPSKAACRLQQTLNSQLLERGIRLAVVVSNSPMAYLARQTFFGLHHRVFYDDVDHASRWLRESGESD